MDLHSFVPTLSFFHLLLLFSLFCRIMHPASGATVGVAYGRVGNNLPTPSDVVTLLQRNSVSKVFIYNTDKNVLDAFQNSGIKLIVSASNGELANLASSGASNWVKANIVPYAHIIEMIAVGNEVLTKATDVSKYLYPAIVNVYNALKNAGLDSTIHVSTTHAMDVIDPAKPFPPSKGTFANSIQSEMGSILNFLSRTGAPFLANVYPYFAYIGAGGKIPIEYALFKPTTGVDDNGLHYSNLFTAQVDTLISALEAMGHSDIAVVVTESGWPHAGESSATIANAQAYNGNLVANVPKGTPKRPKARLSTYIFALFDENQKPAVPAYEQHFGVYNPSTRTMFYPLTF